MAKFCSECGQPLPNSTSRFCGECGAEQISTGNISTSIGGNAIGSTIISGGRDVNFDKGEAVPCPDCFGTGIEHIECLKCSGDGIIKELKEEEFLKKHEPMTKTSRNFVDFANSTDENSSTKDKVINFAGGLYVFASFFKIAADAEKYAADDKNYREVICSVCEGRKRIPINHEENLKTTKIRNIPVCSICNGYKKVYLPH